MAGLVGIAAGVVVHLRTSGSEDAQAVSGFHGQASWRPHERAAPPFTLYDHSGALVSLGAFKKTPVLLTFLDSRCREQCPIMGAQLGTILRDTKPADRPTLLIVSVNPAGDTPASIRRVMAEWQLDGPWHWHWIRGTERELSAVWSAYGITVEPTTGNIAHGLALYLIDGDGFERTGYLFPFLPNFVALDLRTLSHASRSS
jgi:protein SCO1/2